MTSLRLCLDHVDWSRHDLSLVSCTPRAHQNYFRELSQSNSQKWFVRTLRDWNLLHKLSKFSHLAPTTLQHIRPLLKRRHCKLGLWVLVWWNWRSEGWQVQGTLPHCYVPWTCLYHFRITTSVHMNRVSTTVERLWWSLSPAMAATHGCCRVATNRACKEQSRSQDLRDCKRSWLPLEVRLHLVCTLRGKRQWDFEHSWI